MRVEEFMDDDEAVVRVEIPGVDPEKDIDISVASGRLVVSAKREQRETKSEDGRRSEFHYGSFRRTMTLPPGVDADDVHATLHRRHPRDSGSGGRRGSGKDESADHPIEQRLTPDGGVRRVRVDVWPHA